MKSREIMASEQRAINYLMFFGRVGIIPLEGWDRQEIDDHARKDEEVRRFLFERRMVKVEGQTIRLEKPLWNVVIDLKKEDGEWNADYVYIGKRLTGDFLTRYFGKEELKIVDKLMSIREEFAARRIRPIRVGPIRIDIE